MDVNIPLG